MKSSRLYHPGSDGLIAEIKWLAEGVSGLLALPFQLVLDIWNGPLGMKKKCNCTYPNEKRRWGVQDGCISRNIFGFCTIQGNV